MPSINFPGDDRTRVGIHLQRINAWLGGRPIRIEQVLSRGDRVYGLDGAAFNRITEKCHAMCEKQVKGGELLLLPGQVSASLAFFGYDVPRVSSGPVDADGHSFTRE